MDTARARPARPGRRRYAFETNRDKQMEHGVFYIRPEVPAPEEPQDRLVLRSSGSRGTAVSGVEFHTPPRALLGTRSQLELERVPEPGNPWDRSAVAIDFAGQRIGYLPAETAPAWQPYVLAKREAGTAIFLPGTMGDGRCVTVLIFAVQ